jgi:hypothetical protein
MISESGFDDIPYPDLDLHPNRDALTLSKEPSDLELNIVEC